MLRRTWVLVVVVVLAGSVLAACGGDDDGGSGRSGGGASSGGGGSADQPLEGTQWILDQQATKLTVVVPSAVVTAQFSSDGRVSGNGGCNQYGGSYSISGSKMTVDDSIVATRMACAAPVMRVETAYLARLPKARSFSIDGSVLTIETSGEGPLVYDALDPEQAVAGDWVVINYFRPGAVVSPVVGSELTAAFDAGQISGNSGCNQYSGPYEVDDTKITIGPLASTLRACADPAVDQQEREYLAALELARTFSLDGGNLTLLREDGGIAVTFQPA
ncbi:MAG: META domain-containing protein [Actinobacteria bacterium]|nr:META domain-containing protein [Actinomycetota bacterium]